MLKKTVLLFTTLTFLTISTLNCQAQQTTSREGTVTQTMDSAGYTYVQVDEGVAQTWVAIPQTPVSVGAKVRYEEGMVMKDFHAKSLNRTFPAIVFSSGITVQESSPAAPQVEQSQPSDNSFAAAVAREQQQPQPSSGVIAGQVSAGSMGAVVPATEVDVPKAEGENGFTVVEIFSKAQELNGQKVRLRGKVVKFSPHIMGRNWVHLQDGTGDPMANTHDLVVTTNAVVENDQIVEFEGTLAADKDFGAGYSYTAILEEAQIIQ